MKQWLAILTITLALPSAALAEEKKSFWAKLVPDNSSALEFIDGGKEFAGQLFEDTKSTGQSLFSGGMNLIKKTGDTIKSLGGDE